MTAIAEAVRASSPTVKRDAARSAQAKAMVAELLALPPEIRREIVAALSPRELALLLAATNAATGTPFGLYADDPVGFVSDVLGETMWSRQRAVLEKLAGTQRVAVPAGFGLGKTHLAARAVVHFCCTNAVGTAQAVTTATRMRQVQRQLWPHIRRIVARAGLPGKVDTTQWRMPDQHGVPTDVAYGFTAPENDEAAMQGIHAPKLLLVVDEAGGISRLVGSGTNNLLTGDHARLLAIGNPAADDENTWFEGLCEEGFDPAEEDTVTVRIAATDSPAVTGEDAGVCRDCPPNVPAHPLAQHLVDGKWIARAIKDHGADAPYVVAKVHAKFPKGGSSRILPVGWVENACEPVEPDDDEHVPLAELGLPEEEAPWMVKRGAWVRLGIDVAADGGDELVISRAVGDLVTVEHVSSGSQNANSLTVAGKILVQIRRAEQLAEALGSTAQVRAKIDANGVGWGVAGTLAAWASEGKHGAEIVPVMVSELTNREPDGSTMVPYRKRDEMWIAMRKLLQPSPEDGRPQVRLRVDEKTQAQLTGPRYGTTSGGQTQVESKKAMRQRGLRSPDRAEAVLHAVYEPAPAKSKRRRSKLITLGGESML